MLPHIEPIIVDRKNNLNLIKLYYKCEAEPESLNREWYKLNIAILKLLGEPGFDKRWPLRSDFDGLTN
jgi:hypothetical protein